MLSAVMVGSGAAAAYASLSQPKQNAPTVVTIDAAGTVTVDVQAGGEVPIPSPTPSPGANQSEPDGAGGGDAEAILAGGIEAAELLTSDEPDAKSSRLLALVAAICVFGVSVAIIRAILAQRTSGMVGT